MRVDPLPDRQPQTTVRRKRGRPASPDKLVSLTVAVTVAQRQAIEALAIKRGDTVAAITREVLAVGLAALEDEKAHRD